MLASFLMPLAQAENEARLGCEAIAHLPASIYKQALIDLAEFAVKRDF